MTVVSMRWCLLYVESCSVCVRFWPRSVSHLPCPHGNLWPPHEWLCHVLRSSVSLRNPSSLQRGNEWREVTKDKRHCRAEQDSARRGLHFPPDRIDKGHQGLAGISLAPADPQSRPSLWTRAKSTNHNTVCHLSSLATGLQVFVLSPN